MLIILYKIVKYGTKMEIKNLTTNYLAKLRKDINYFRVMYPYTYKYASFWTVLRIRIWIRIHWIHVFLGLQDPDPDPLVRGMDPDPDPSIIMQNSKKILDSSY